MVLNFELDQKFNTSAVDFTQSLSRIKCPTLVLGGEDDPVTTIEDVQDVASAIPPELVRFESFPNAGHGIVHDQPERFLRVVGEFIAACGGEQPTKSSPDRR